MPSMTIMFSTLGVFSFLCLQKPQAILLHHIATCAIFHSRVSCGQAFLSLSQRLSIKLWSYNSKMLLLYLSLLPVIKDAMLNYSKVNLPGGPKNLLVHIRYGNQAQQRFTPPNIQPPGANRYPPLIQKTLQPYWANYKKADKTDQVLQAIRRCHRLTNIRDGRQW